MPPLMPTKRFGEALLEAVNATVVERRDVAVLLWRQALEPRLAGVNPDGVGAGGGHRVGQRVERRLRILFVDADAAFDRDGHTDRRLHRGDDVADQRGRPHQAGAEGAGLHAVRRTADIEVDLVVAEVGGDPRRLRQLRRLGAAELKRDRVLGIREADQPLAVAMNDRVGDDHFGVEERPARQLPVEHAAVAVGPVHHGRHGNDVRGGPGRGEFCAHWP